MKRLLQYGLTDCWGSFMPIVMWFLMGLLWGDSSVANGFSYTGMLQYIYMLCFHICVMGSLKGEYREEGYECRFRSAYSGIAVYVGVCLALNTVILLSIGEIRSFYGVEVDIYPLLFMYGSVSLGLDCTICSLKLILQYKGRVRASFRMYFLWNVLKVLSVVTARFMCKYVATGLVVALVLQVLVCCVYMVIYFRLPAFRFSLPDSVRYASNSAVSDICMFLIYVFGVRVMTEGSAVVLGCYNMLSMCTDTQWDALCTAVDTYVSKATCEGVYRSHEKGIMRECFAYGVLLVGSSLVLLCGGYFAYDSLDLGVLLLLFCLEMSTFLPNVVKYCFSSYIMVYHPVIWVPVINFAGYCLRFLSQWLLSGYYFSVSAAVAISTPVSIVLVAVLYVWFRRKYWVCDG